MPVIQDVITDAEGVPQSGVKVIVRLKSLDFDGGFVPTAASTIFGTHDIFTDSDGFWSANIVGNSLIDPDSGQQEDGSPTSFYEIVYDLFGEARSFQIQVPSA